MAPLSDSMAPLLSSAITRLVILAASYVSTGLLGLTLAVPPGYATAVWPPSGIALACMLIWGNRVWPGIWVGSFLLNVWVAFQPAHSISLTGVTVAACIASGSTLQMFAGAWLVRRFVGSPGPLDTPWLVFRFLLLGGPLSCVIGASVGVSTLVLAGLVRPEDALFSWWNWWIGDSMGVLIVSPIVFIGGAEPRAVWDRRKLTVAAPLAIAFALATAVFLQISRIEQQRIEAEFERRAVQLSEAIRDRLDQAMEAPQVLRDWLNVSPSIPERRQFRAFAQSYLARHGAIAALEWMPRVTDAQRAAYEARVRREGFPDFRIAELDETGGLTKAGSRQEYFPVHYLEPFRSNEAALGFDMASRAGRQVTIDKAVASGRVVATEGIGLVQDAGKEIGILLLTPVYAPHTGPEPREGLSLFRDLHSQWFACGTWLKARCAASTIP